MDDIMHTVINEPVEVRKDLLSCAIDCVEVLKDMDHLDEIFKEKLVLKKKILTVVRNINKDINSFKRGLPEIVLPKVKAVKEIEERFEEVREVKEEEIHIDRLSSELEEIKNKLNKLEF